MKKLKKIEVAGIVLACVGIVLFWVFGWNDMKEWASYSFIGAGISAWVALFAIIGGRVLEKRYIP